LAAEIILNMNRSDKVVIIDYELSNLFSVQQACRFVGLDAVISRDKREILGARGVILPGVGAFGDAMENLERLDLIAPIKDVIAAGTPFMGICLGMQLLFTESEEFGAHKGLDIIQGSIRRFPKQEPGGSRIRVPQISWNRVQKPGNRSWEQTPFSDLDQGEFMYFVHSFYALPQHREDVLSETGYHTITYCSGVQKQNVFATQFHPEKSAEKGLTIYKNWAKTLN
jgi:glutamine amidotransferase